MPNTRALPDVLSDQWSELALWRGASFTANFRLSFIITCIITIFSAYFTYYCYNVCNIRKCVFLFTIALLFRCIVLLVNQLPPPCQGFPNCRCAQIRWSDLRERNSALRIVLIYLATFGFGTSRVPACGDTMMSGHATIQICLGLYLIDTMALIVTTEKLNAVKFTVFVLIGLSAIYAVLIRSEYTISVSISIAFVCVMAWLYGMGETMYDVNWGPFVMSRVGKAFVLMAKEIDEILHEERSDE
jgi:hypothetical protein